MAELRITHLYPDTLRLNGEVGNLMALKQRAEQSGITVRISRVEIGQALPTKRPHIIFIGSGTLGATKAAQTDLASRANLIHKLIALGTKVLAVGTGFDLISQRLHLPDGSTLEGLGLTNTTHSVTGNHLVGEVWVSESFAGFINSDREIVRGASGQELAVVKYSDNDALVNYVDGYQDGKVMASNIQGPLLPMNPKLTDQLLGWVFSKEDLGRPSPKLVLLAKQARAAILGRVRS